MRENMITSVVLKRDTSSAAVSDAVAPASTLESPMLIKKLLGDRTTDVSSVHLRPAGKPPEGFGLGLTPQGLQQLAEQPWTRTQRARGLHGACTALGTPGCSLRLELGLGPLRTLATEATDSLHQHPPAPQGHSRGTASTR